MSSIAATISRQPPNTALKQQRIKAWNPILDPVWVIVTLLIMGAAFVPIGFVLLSMNDKIVEMTKVYDSYYPETIDADLDCTIANANENKSCTIEFEVERDMEAPVLLYYGIDNFYQNHREYTTSKDEEQLLGSLSRSSLRDQQCDPLNEINGTRINPCGLIANTLFNDNIKLAPGSVDVDGNAMELDETGIAWTSDIEYAFRQPDGFRKQKCTSSCDTCTCPDDWSCEEPFVKPETGECFIYDYPEANKTQYLFQTYPDIISPLEGVLNEHFIVWMRVAAKPNFRKLYGYFHDPIKAGTKVTFDVSANWDVQMFKGTKKLILTTTNSLGGYNPNLGNAFIGVGAIFLGSGLLFGLKHLIKPRRLADKKYLKYKNE